MRRFLACAALALLPACNSTQISAERFAVPVLKMHVASREMATRAEPGSIISDALHDYLQSNAEAWEDLYNMLVQSGTIPTQPTE